MLVDSVYEKELGVKTPAFFSVYRFDDTASTRKNVIRVSFNFTRYSKNETSEFFNSRKGDLRNGNNALVWTSFGTELVEEMNSRLGMEYFPPMGDTVKVVVPEDAPQYYEWRTNDGWLISTGFHGITVEISERKKL